MRKELQRLKGALAAYLLLEQGYGENIPLAEASRRIDFSRICRPDPGSGPPKLDPNFRILSWNYDLQPELAFSRYLPNYDISEIQSLLGAYPRRKTTDIFAENQFCLVRLNGTAGLLGQRLSSNELIPAYGFLKNPSIQITSALS